ncbi:hypothetical protein LTR85_004879 [Meristemomyces frigidus]|nr:hypothetical protein LTR85_004879 [Meristemomyces frigidus]
MNVQKLTTNPAVYHNTRHTQDNYQYYRAAKQIVKARPTGALFTGSVLHTTPARKEGIDTTEDTMFIFCFAGPRLRSPSEAARDLFRTCDLFRQAISEVDVAVDAFYQAETESPWTLIPLTQYALQSKRRCLPADFASSRPQRVGGEQKSGDLTAPNDCNNTHFSQPSTPSPAQLKPKVSNPRTSSATPSANTSPV